VLLFIGKFLEDMVKMFEEGVALLEEHSLSEPASA
jgi:hypothetical protein